MCDDERTLKAEKQERQNQYWSLLIFVWDATLGNGLCAGIRQQNEKDTISIDLGQRSFRLIENIVVLGRPSTTNIEKVSGK